MKPKDILAESLRHFNSIIGHVADLCNYFRDATRNYLFTGNANPDGSISDDHADFVMILVAAQPINEAVIMDGRVSYSRRDKCIGATKFEIFWKEFQEILLPNIATDEYRKGHCL